MTLETKNKFKLFRKYIVFIFLFLIIYQGVMLHSNYVNGKFKETDNYAVTETLEREQFYDLVRSSQIVSTIKETDSNFIIKTVDGKYYNLPYSEEYVKTLELEGVVEDGSELLNPSIFSLILTTVMALGVLGLFAITLLTAIRNYLWDTQIPAAVEMEMGMGLGGINQQPQQPVEEEETLSIKKITFDDVQGIDELKPDLYRLVDCLKNPDKYTQLGARLPKGVILYGPPGTGKTLTAKALAGEAGVPFFSASGSDFIEKYVGVGASRIRDLYKRARKAAPCIVFIDEIDAIGGGRGESSNGEKDQTINALLTELDGIQSMEGVLTICATNRLDILDPALMRAGRFDLKLAIELPDKKGRLQILELHSKNKKLSEEVSLEALSKKTIGFAGAELENLLNESALIAATANKEAIDNEDLENAFFKIIMDGNKKKRDENDKSATLVAYHEAGHTLATKLLTNDSVPTVTIVQSTSGAGGVTFTTPEEMGLHSKKYLRNQIKVSYAGRAAEEILLGDEDDITTGASQDIKHATSILKAYIGNYGMGSKGMIDIKQLTHNYDIVEEASELANKLYKETLEILIENKDKLERIAFGLLEKETLDEVEIDGLIAGKSLEELLPTIEKEVENIETINI